MTVKEWSRQASSMNCKKQSIWSYTLDIFVLIMMDANKPF